MSRRTDTTRQTLAAPKFSIVVPTYNREGLLPRAVDSVLRQTYTDFELIVADDGSSDDTRRVVEDYVAEDPRVRYCHQENKGGAAARNLGASFARGEYLAFLDSDDEADPNWIESFSSAFTSTDVSIVCCGIRYVEDGNVWRHRFPVERNGLFLSGTFALRRHVFRQVNGYNTALPANQQSELRFRLLQTCKENNWEVKCVSEPLVTSHRHDGPNIREDILAVYESAVFIIEEHRQRLLENPRSYASWATSAGGYAARLGKYSEARNLFCRAVAAYPRDLKNYARVLVSLIPGLRYVVWQKTS